MSTPCSACDRPPVPSFGLCISHLDRDVLVRELERVRAELAEAHSKIRYLEQVARRGR